MLDLDAKSRFKQTHKHDVQEESGYQSKWNPGDIQVLERTRENIPPHKRFHLGSDSEGLFIYDLWEEEPRMRGFNGYPDALARVDALNGKPNRYGDVEGPIL